MIEKTAETERKKRKIEAESKKEVAEITRQREEIENQIELAKKKAATDAEFYKATKEAEANKSKFTKEYL